MNSDEMKNRSVQTDLVRNASNMLQAVACMDDEALQDISKIVMQIERLADKMESRIGIPSSMHTVPRPQYLRPKLTLVSDQS